MIELCLNPNRTRKIGLCRPNKQTRATGSEHGPEQNKRRPLARGASCIKLRAKVSNAKNDAIVVCNSYVRVLQRKREGLNLSGTIGGYWPDED